MILSSCFKAVIFDMDGVITNTMPYHYDAWSMIFRSVGIKVTCYDIYCREGQDGLTSVIDIFKQYNRKISLKDAKLVLSKKEALFKRIVKTKFVPGARPFLKELKKRKFRLALVTGTSRHEAERILHKQLFGLFDVSVTGDEVRKGKPDPEPFLKALNLLKIPPAGALVIENAPFGIESAKRAGLFCVALETSLPGKYLKKADMVFKSFKELKRRLFTI